jgi:hypothetical protein
MSPETTTQFSSIAAVPAAAPAIRRKITPQAGKALELLAHALEYLSDECAVSHEKEPQLQDCLEAIHLLMALNRGIYFGCPPAPGVGERCRTFWRRYFPG